MKNNNLIIKIFRVLDAGQLQDIYFSDGIRVFFGFRAGNSTKFFLAEKIRKNS